MAQPRQRPERGLFIEYEIPIRTYDTDYAGIVNNIVYLRYFEDMRGILFEKYFSLKQFLDEGKTPVIASHNIHYKRPLKLFDKPKAIMWISELTNASMTITGEIYVDGKLTTFVDHVGVFIDMASGRPIRVPAVCTEAYNNATELLPQP